jgi:hypothetical protein
MVVTAVRLGGDNVGDYSRTGAAELRISVLPTILFHSDTFNTPPVPICKTFWVLGTRIKEEERDKEHTENKK